MLFEVVSAIGDLLSGGEVVLALEGVDLFFDLVQELGEFVLAARDVEEMGIELFLFVFTCGDGLT